MQQKELEKNIVPLADIDSVDVNYEKIKKTEKLNKQKDKLWGKGKFRQTIESVLLATSSIVELLKGLGIWNYAENIAIGNLTTKFNAWVATLKVGKNALLTAAEWSSLTSTVANTFGIAFSTVLTFVINHPTVTLLGLSALTTTLLVPFKALIRKLKGQKQRKEQQIPENIRYEIETKKK